MTKTESKEARFIPAKEITKRFNISYQVLNHYTNFGLLPIHSKEGNIRFYNRSLVKNRLKKIKELMRQGYSLLLIRKKLIGV